MSQSWLSLSRTRVLTLTLTILASLALPGICAAPGSHRAPGKANAMMMQTGYVSFDVPDCRSRSTVHEFSSPQIAAAATGADGNMLCVTLGSVGGATKCTDLARFNPKTGKFTYVAALPEDAPTFMDITWHSPTSSFLALVQYPGHKTTSLMQVSTGGNLKKIKDYDKLFFGITSDEAGRLFFVDRDEGRLYWTEADGTDVPSANPMPISMQSLEGLQAKYISSIDMDQDSYYVYYAITASDGKVSLVRYDPLTGVGKTSGEIGSKSKEITGMSIVRKSRGTAAAPTDLKVSVGANGQTTANASWKAAGSCAVYLNGSLMAETDARSYSFSDLREGYNYLRVVGMGSDGTPGNYTDAFFWAGPDILGPVTDVKSSRVYPDSARLEWKAPTETVHGGYYSPNNVKYRITRFASDGTSGIVANTHRGTSYIEKITVPDVYHYTIQSLSTNFGETYTTEPTYFGPAMDTPYRCVFNNQDAVKLWAKYKQPGNNYGWIWNDLLGCMYTTPLTIGNDDWLISPPVKLKKGKEYVIYTQAGTGSGPKNPRNMEIGVGLSGDTAQMKAINSVTIDNYTSEGPRDIRIIYTPSQDGEYSFYLRDLNPPINANLSVYAFSVLDNNLGHISGTVTDASTGEKLKGVEVAVKGTSRKTLTDAQGHYDINYIEGNGKYTLTASIFGYLPYTSQEVSAPDGKNTTFDFAIQPTPEITVTGKITDYDGNPLPDTRILLTNYGKLCETHTDADGKYSVKAMQNGTYRIELYKHWHRSVVADFSASADTAADYKMLRKELTPNKPVVDNATEGPKVSWDSPYDLLRRDSNKPVSQFGNREGFTNSLYGTVWRMPAIVNAISWQTTAYLGPHDKVNVWILDLTPEGYPSTKVLYNAMGVDSKDVKWIRHKLDKPVECPNGFYMALSQDKGMISLATADGKDPEWPYVFGMQYRSYDYTTGTWYSQDGVYMNNNYMLRAECSAIGGDNGECLYKLWRLQDGNENDQSTWTLLEENYAGNTYADTAEPLPSGCYRYALSVAYPDGSYSTPVISDAFDTRLAGVGLTSRDGFNPTPNPVENTLHLGTVCDNVTLYDLSGRMMLNESNVAELDLSRMPKGYYLLEASKENKKTTVKIIKK